MESILSKVLFPDSYKIQGFYFIFFLNSRILKENRKAVN